MFSIVDAMLFCQNTCKPGNSAIEISQVFHDIAWFECFTDLNLFKYLFNVIFKIGNWMFYNFILWWLFCFVSSYGRRI